MEEKQYGIGNHKNPDHDFRLQAYHPTADEMADRLSLISELILRGARRSEIIEWVATNRSEWGIAESTVVKYIRMARESIRKDGQDRDFGMELGKSLMRLDDLYSKAMAAMEYRTALGVMKEINRLWGFDKAISERLIKEGQVLPPMEQLSFDDLYKLKHGSMPPIQDAIVIGGHNSTTQVGINKQEVSTNGGVGIKNSGKTEPVVSTK
jgi:hypothetical protein